MAFALLLACCLQDTERIHGLHREGYQTAWVEYERALRLTESDPKQALQILDRLFDNKKLDKKDRLLISENPKGESKPLDFFPNQARGRVRLVLAKSDSDNASTLLAGAITDLKASVDAGVKSSEDLLRLARGAQDRLKTLKAAESAKESAAEKGFRDSWLQLIDDRKFKSAEDLLDSKSSPLSAEKKKSYARDTEDRCRRYVAAALDDFLKAMELNIRPPLLRQVKVADFARLFALPPDSEVVGAHPELDWGRMERLLVEKVRVSEPRPQEKDALGLLEALIAQMLATAEFEKTGENRWFKVSGQLTFHYVEDLLLNFAQMSKEVGPEQRLKLHETAEQIRAKWVQALSKVPRDYLMRNQVHENPKRLSTLLDEFPVDSAEIDKIDLDACFVGEAPDAALDHVISDLTKLRDQQGARLPKDSMRKLLTELLAATAMHDLLAGKAVEEVTKGLQELGRSLNQAGGPIEPARWGPKIERIFGALK